MKRRIAIVEDDAAISDILSILLRRNGYLVDEYFSGEQVLHHQVERPDLFIMDKQLADMDGVDICRHLKSQPDTCNIPVIIVSASPGLEKLVQLAGADAFIEKPFTSRTLLSTIYGLLQASPAAS